MEHFVTSITPKEIRWHYDEKSKMECHDLILRPLIQAAKKVYIYGLKEGSEIYEIALPILIKSKGKYEIDLSKEVISEHEYLWNSHGWKRGSILIILPNSFDFNTIIENCHSTGIFYNPNTGNTLSAIKKAKKEVENNNISVILPASNGIEWMQVYYDKEKSKDLFKLISKLIL